MYKKNKILSILLSFCFMFVIMVGLVGCGNNTSGGSDEKNNTNGGGTQPSSPVLSVSAKEVVNQSLEKLESSMGNISSASNSVEDANAVNYTSSAVIPNPYSDTYETKTSALLAMLDVFQGQYQMQYVINYANSENGYKADLELGKVYRTSYGSPQSTDPTVNIFNQYIKVTQTTEGVVFQNDIPVKFEMNGNKMETYFQYYFKFNYDYENNKPLSMTLYIKQITEQSQASSENVSKQLAIIMSKVDYTENVVYQLNFAGNFDDLGENVLQKLDNNEFTSDKFISESGIFGYLFEKVELNSNANDYKIYNHKSGSIGTATKEIDQTFCDDYDQIYNALKNEMHSKPALETANAIDLGDRLYNNMYYYASQVIGTLDTSSGNLKVRAIKELSQIKTILEDLKLEFETNTEYNQTSGVTYNQAKSFVEGAISYVSTLKQGTWLGFFDDEKTNCIVYNSISNCYCLEYKINGEVKCIYFTLDSNGKATLFSNETLSTDADK